MLSVNRMLKSLQLTVKKDDNTVMQVQSDLEYVDMFHFLQRNSHCPRANLPLIFPAHLSLCLIHQPAQTERIESVANMNNKSNQTNNFTNILNTHYVYICLFFCAIPSLVFFFHILFLYIAKTTIDTGNHRRGE